MTFWAFVRDRWIYSLAYTAFGLAIVAVVEFDTAITGQRMDISSLLYLLLLGLVGLLAFLGFEYQRQKGFWSQLEAISGSEPLDQLGSLPEATSLEQQIAAQAWSRLYRRMRSELTLEQERGQRNTHLISQWAHHMKTPVSVIDLELQKASQQPWAAEAQPFLQSLGEENGRLQYSLQMLLNMVRLEDFAADFAVAQVELVDLVRQLVNDHKRAFIVNRIYPKIEAPVDLPLRVETDAKWLRFALEQVLSNALKYAARPDGQGQIRFRITRELTETVLTVEDDGIGIAPEEVGRVFAPFFTGTNGRAFPQATGMGLYLAKEICQRLGHRITLRSQRGEGTQVSFHFAESRAIFTDLGLQQR